MGAYRFKRVKRSPWHGWYQEKAWLDCRARQLAREPWCCICVSVGRYEVACEVDHIKPHRGDRRLFFDGANLQSMCKSCHSRKTAQEVAGQHTELMRPPACVRVVCLDAGKGSRAAEGVARGVAEHGWRVVDLRPWAGRARIEKWNDHLFSDGDSVLVLSSIGSWQERTKWVSAIGDGVDRVLVDSDPWCMKRTEGREVVHVHEYITLL